GYWVIDVDGKAVKAITGSAFEQWHLRMHLERGRDRPVVVLNVEDHRGVKGGSKDHGLVDVAFGRSAITKARNSYPAFCSTARIGPTALLLGNPPAIAHCVGHLSGEYYGVRLHVVVVGVPAAVDGTAEEIEYVFIGDTASASDDVFAIRGEDPVAVLERGHDPGLRGFLPQRWGPQHKLTLTLEVHTFLIEAAGMGHQAVHFCNPLVTNGSGIVDKVFCGIGRINESVGRQHANGFLWKLMPGRGRDGRHIRFSW